MRRIKSSKLNQFFEDLFPEYVLYRIDDRELDKQDAAESEEYLSAMAKKPDEYYKRLNEERRTCLRERAIQKRILHKDRQYRKRKPPFVRLVQAGEDGRPKSFDETRKAHPSEYGLWTREEETKLINEFSEGISVYAISKLHGRKPGGIRSRLKKLKLLN
ncbi:hypothetical protein AUJ65_02735 [Candidatus Micrarchaeota archaeon CG1_02_51_15]|nr:MAG: hypothetical protein AUJ65_02735 [Candidatus Micrarchaeota archaeon CG1_02_51_15]